MAGLTLKENVMKERRNSQKRYILNHLRRYGFINPMVALREYGSMRLGARIADLREEGYNIITEPTESISPLTGNPVRYATYRLIEP